MTTDSFSLCSIASEYFRPSAAHPIGTFVPMPTSRDVHIVEDMDTRNSPVRHVLIDRLVDNERPNLRDAIARHRPGCLIEVFDFLSAPVSIAEVSRHGTPDLVVVDAVWLHLSPLLDRIMSLAECQSAVVVVASRHVDDVFKVQAEHRGFEHFLDLTQASDPLVERLFAVSKASTPAPTPHLWNSVPLAAMSHSGVETARDAIDREILDLVSVGMQDADIANVVHASTQTVKNRISAMLERSGYRNRTQLAWMHSNQVLADAMVRSLPTGS